ncbi:MAG: hypothetical protein V4591_05515 [Bdellovibrionota bacterium]
MFQRFLSLGAVPELRPDPVQSEKVGNEVEVVMPIDVYWQIEDLIKDIRYARIQGNDTQKLWSRFARLIYPCIVLEKDRQWFKSRIVYLI